MTVLMLFLVVLMGAYGWGWWQQRAVRLSLSQAETKLNEGKPAEADALLAEYLDGDRPNGAWVDQALELRFKALDQLIDQAPAEQKQKYLSTAQALADRVLDAKRPWVKKGQNAWARAHLVLAAASLQAEKVDAAMPHINAVVELPEGTPGRDEAQLNLIRIKMSQGEVSTAQKELDALLTKLPENSTARRGVEQNLGLCNMSILKSQEALDGDIIYEIQKGDTLDRLKRKFRVSPEILQAINAPLNPSNLKIGRRIKIPNLQFSILVNKMDNTLTLYNHGKFFKKYRVRTGNQSYRTPEGDFKIGVKMVNAPWTNPKDNRRYAGGEPGNELGCRWMSFYGSSIGIHEAIEPETIGTHSSNGCVGMLRDDVVELYDLVPVGTPVKIINKAAATPLTMPVAGVKTGGFADGAGEAAVAADGEAAATDETQAAAADEGAAAAGKKMTGAKKGARTKRTSKAGMTTKKNR